MGIDGYNAWRKLGLVAAICLIVALGELRTAGSEAIASTGSPARAGDATSVAFDASAPLHLGDDEDGASLGSADDAHLVPAIYAWDPDVRFVYFRHVSKWM